MSYSPPYTYIEADTLADALRKRSEQPGKLAVVDVRDDDYEGGHIKGAIHSPSSTFLDKVDQLALGQLRDCAQVVFHCSLSQQRGPKAARIYRETRDNLASIGKLGDPVLTQQVLVLRDGFSNFGPRFKHDPALVEDFDEDSWAFR